MFKEGKYRISLISDCFNMSMFYQQRVSALHHHLFVHKYWDRAGDIKKLEHHLNHNQSCQKMELPRIHIYLNKPLGNLSARV